MKPIVGGVITKGEVSLKYILNQSFVDVVIPEMDSREVVDRNVVVFEAVKELSTQEREYIEEVRQTIGNQFCRRCRYCRPFPQNIDIPTQFIFEGYLNWYKIPNWAKDRYEKLDVKADVCVQCGQCEDKCPYELPIINMLIKVSEAFRESN